MNDNFLSNKELRKIKLKSFGKGVQISPNVTIIGAKNIQIGDNVRIDDYTIISAKEGYLKLASNIHIGGQCYLGCGGGIEISRNVNIAQGVKIYSKINDYIKFHLLFFYSKKRQHLKRLQYFFFLIILELSFPHIF